MRWSMIILLLVSLAALTPAAQETGKKDKNSTRIVTVGCLKGRVLRATGQRDGESKGPDVSGRSFRLAGPKPVMEDVKRHNGHLVEVEGLVKNADLADTTAGFQVGGARVVVGAPPMSSDPTQNVSRTPTGGLAVMDVTAVKFLAEECPIPR